jgi:opacity protein-like surface antigen
MARSSRVFAIGLLLPLTASPYLVGQTRDIAEFYGGYNYTKASPDPLLAKQSLNGFVVGAGVYANSWFGVDFEASKQYGTAGASAAGFANSNVHESSYLAGPQFRFLNRDKVNASFRALLGGVQGQIFQPGGSAASQTRFALFLGAGVDFGVTRLLAIRVEPGLYRTSFSHLNQNNFRISFGPVLRFGGNK